ncbi:AAA family ATPase [Streptomyces sp. NPDC056512]|uniref:AAA family ATPase n=1 Tax=Streptomyces sp. NPDC056512 TaxID=3345846 RepID=UPI0036BC4D99
MESMLIVIGGLPGTGKSTLARLLAARIGAVHLRIDTIEQAIVRSGLAKRPLGPSATRSDTPCPRSTSSRDSL